MPHVITVLVCLVAGISSAEAFFIPLTTEERVAGAGVIAVIKVTDVDLEANHSDAVVIEDLKGCKKQEKIRIWDDAWIDKDGNTTYLSGRDAYLQEGKTYFIYLAKNGQGKLVTVQSSLDCLEVTDGNVKKEGADGVEPLEKKIAATRERIAELEKAEKPASSGDGNKPD